MMPKFIPNLRIFLSSPSDVNDERKIALDVIERLPYKAAYRERVSFTVIAWDKTGADTPLRATMTPQEAINRVLPLPSDSYIVVVLFFFLILDFLYSSPMYNTFKFIKLLFLITKT